MLVLCCVQAVQQRSGSDMQMRSGFMEDLKSHGIALLIGTVAFLLQLIS
jgi:hypothetical protein